MKKKLIIAISTVSLISAVFIIILIISNKNSQPKETNTPIQNTGGVANYKNIIPGSTDVNQLKNVLGEPLSSTTSGDIKILDFKSSSQYRDNQIALINNKVSIIKEVINPDDSRNAENIRNIYGINAEVLYKKSEQNPFNLYVYPSNGIAYLGHSDGTLLEIWYFVPTTIDDFINKWGSDYSKEPSKVIPQY